MGRAFKRSSIFVLLCGVIYLAAMTVMAHLPFQGKPLIFRTGDYYNWPGGDTWQRFQEFEPKQHYDVVIIGSSHAYRGYDPFVFTQLGLSVFNLGSSAQAPLNTYWIVKEYLDSTNTGLLILDTYEGVMQGTGLESTSDLTQNQPSDAAAAGMAWSLRDLRGMNMVALRLLARNSSPFYTDTAYAGLGFVPQPDSVKTDAPPPPKKPVVLAPRMQYFLDQTLALCRARGIPVVISSHYARRDRRGSAHEVLARYLAQISRCTGVPYLDFTDAPGIEDRNWFLDNNHLNATGARIFTEQLADTLEVLGYLKRR